MPIDIPGKVFDYEVGLSSTTGSSAFESSKQHAHHRIMHTNIPDATEFYIIIKSISKSNVEGITVSLLYICVQIFNERIIFIG